MKKLIIILSILLISTTKSFTQKVDSYTTNDFREKPKAIMIFVALSEDAGENKRIANNIMKLLPKETNVLKILNYNKAWTKDYNQIIFEEGLNVGAMAVLKFLPIDSEKKQNLAILNNRIIGYNYEVTKYQCSLEYVNTQLILWNAVSNFRYDGCPYKNFVRQAISDGVL